MWIRGVTQTIGFSLIALSYIFASRYQNTTKQSYLAILAGSAAMILLVIGVLYTINPTGSIYSNLQLFAWANIAMLSFICIFLAKKQLTAKTRSSALAISMLAFVCLWLGQLIFLIFALANGGVFALVGSQLTRAAGLVILITIYYSAIKEPA